MQHGFWTWIFFLVRAQKLFSFPSHISFWQGFTDEVESFKIQTKSLSHDELITLTEDVQSNHDGMDNATKCNPMDLALTFNAFFVSSYNFS